MSRALSMSTNIKSDLREELRQDVKDFLKSGNKITKVPKGATGIDYSKIGYSKLVYSRLRGNQSVVLKGSLEK